LEPAFVVDVFGEVDEQIRSDRLNTFIQRAWPVFVGALVAALLVVIGYWAYGQYRTNESAKASQAYSDALDLENKGDPASAAKAFDQFAVIAKGTGAYASLALMQQAGIRMDQNKPTDAAALFDKAAAATKNPMIADIATLKAAYALMDTAPVAQMIERLTPLTKPDRPYHAQAREALGLAKLGAGQMKDAKADLVALSLLSDTPDSLRQRAQAVIAMIDSGTAGSLKTLAQQALTAAPAQMAPPPQQAPDGQSPDQAQGQPQGQPEAPQ
jgi:hypothetical protein